MSAKIVIIVELWQFFHHLLGKFMKNGVAVLSLGTHFKKQVRFECLMIKNRPTSI